MTTDTLFELSSLESFLLGDLHSEPNPTAQMIHDDLIEIRYHDGSTMLIERSRYQPNRWRIVESGATTTAATLTGDFTRTMGVK